MIWPSRRSPLQAAGPEPVRILHLSIVVLALALGFALEAPAQTLTTSLFERYLESMRTQAGIPSLSGAVLQGGAVVWERSLGRQDLETRTPATPDTPYAIGNLSQALSSTLLLRKCVDQGYLSTLDPVTTWVAEFPEPDTRVGHLLAHAAPGGGYKYDAGRFAALTTVIERCTNTRYHDLLNEDLFARLAMRGTIPGAQLATPTADDQALFPPDQLLRFADVVRRMATPYRVENGTAARSDVPSQPINAATGIVTTLRDLERFDLALRDNFLLAPATQDAAWTNVTVGGVPLPTGLGWFVQNYNGEALVWQYGLVKDAWSSLILKLPRRDATLILLANSDGLSAPFALENGDITTSPFARLFLKILVP
jgi:CubicO group peptidase (beta-lactamase class C family)